MKDIYEQQGLAPNQVQVNAETLPSEKSIEQIRRDIERMTGRPMATRIEPKEDSRA